MSQAGTHRCEKDCQAYHMTSPSRELPPTIIKTWFYSDDDDDDGNIC